MFMKSNKALLMALIGLMAISFSSCEKQDDITPASANTKQKLSEAKIKAQGETVGGINAGSGQ